MSDAQHSDRYLHASDTAADRDRLSAGTKSSTNKSEQHDANAADAIPASKLGSVTDRVRNFVSIIAANVDEHQTQVDAVNGVLNGCDLSAAPPEIIAAVERLVIANDRMRDQLEESQARLREQSKQLQSAEQRAETDALTQVANRGAFDKRLAMQHAKGHASSSVMAILDIDFFKRFNDEHGHRVGDEVLRSVAQMLEARLQPYGLVARFGGEEFCAMIDNLDYDEAIDVVEQTRAAISSREIRFEGKRLNVTMSVGIGKLLPQQSAAEWLQHVDDALYRSKEAGRDCTHYIDGEKFKRVGSNAATSLPTASMKPAIEPEKSKTQIKSSDDVLSAIQVESSELVATVEEVTQTSGEPITTDLPLQPPANGPAATMTDAAERQAEELSRLTAALRSATPTECPKALAYLPDREAMIDVIIDAISDRNHGTRPSQLMAVTLSGTPGASTMRSLLQLVRAAMRSNDRIGCLDHSTLLVCLPECAPAEAMHRAEQICSAAASVGVSLAAIEKSGPGERLAIGIMSLQSGAESGLDDYEHSTSQHSQTFAVDAIDQAISQTQAIAMLAGRQRGVAGDAKRPILTRTCRLDSLHCDAAAGI
jgi:diguanylate cyclase (GGDEF)-like protein